MYLSSRALIKALDLMPTTASQYHPLIYLSRKIRGSQRILGYGSTHVSHETKTKNVYKIVAWARLKSVKEIN